MKKLLNSGYLLMFIVSALTGGMNKDKISMYTKTPLYINPEISYKPGNPVVVDNERGVINDLNSFDPYYVVKHTVDKHTVTYDGQERIDKECHVLVIEKIKKILGIIPWKKKTITFTEYFSYAPPSIEEQNKQETKTSYTPQSKWCFGGFSFASLAALAYWFTKK